jgi:CRISPR-associated protein Cas1
MALSILSRNKVALTTLDDKYLPTAMVLPFEGHARQSQIMYKQIRYCEENKKKLWMQIVCKKINNQARTLSILGLEGAEKVMSYASDITFENVDYNEALAAKDYFSFFHPGLNRRVNDPINSRLNYGYAVVRSAIARSLVSKGFHPTFGIHHDNQLNAFNLADDLIEPWRPMVDLVTYENIGSNVVLSKNERYELAHVLHNACMIGKEKMPIISAIDIMCESLKKCYM